MTSPRMALAGAGPERTRTCAPARAARGRPPDDGDVARHDAAATRVRVALVRGQALAAWCPARGIGEALVGGFFTRPACEPLGELRTSGIARASVPFDAPWGSQRACVHVQRLDRRLAPRDALPAQPPGDLLQAGPLLVRDGVASTTARDDPEGFSAGSSPVRLRHHRRAPPPGRARARRRRPARGRLRRPLPRRRRAHARGARGRPRRARRAERDQPRRRRLDLAGRRRPPAQPARADDGIPEPGGRAVATALVFEPA